MPAAGDWGLPLDIGAVGPLDGKRTLLGGDAVELRAAPHRPVLGVSASDDQERKEGRQDSSAQGFVSEAGSSAGMLIITTCARHANDPVRDIPAASDRLLI